MDSLKAWCQAHSHFPPSVAQSSLVLADFGPEDGHLCSNRGIDTFVNQPGHLLLHQLVPPGGAADTETESFPERLARSGVQHQQKAEDLGQEGDEQAHEVDGAPKQCQRFQGCQSLLKGTPEFGEG